jgi:hypothetical protein
MTAGGDSMVHIQYRWVPVEVGNGVPFEFCASGANSNSQLPQVPAVYHWAVYEKKILRKVYIGEAENLRKRIGQYFNPGPTQSTNLRLNAILQKDNDAGLCVRLEVLQVVPTYLNDIYICDGRFSDQYVRKMMENLTLADSDVTQYEILNLTSNPLERRKRKAMKDNPLETFSQQHGLTG